MFTKPFTQQCPIPQVAQKAALEILQSGRLHRYNTLGNETSPVATLEAAYARYQEARYCVAVSSGGQAIQIALRAAGVQTGDKILANAYTLAPVPGAIHAVGGIPVFVEIAENWRINLDDLKHKAETSQARFLLLSHMRGHSADMDAIVQICTDYEITLIEDCAHTMGAKWNGIRSGNFGKVACFSCQTYKHINSGEGGLLTTNDDSIAAQAIIMSGSYMLYERHGTIPPAAAFEAIKLKTPNLSARMDNLRAAILLPQLDELEDNIRAWNIRYDTLLEGLQKSSKITIPPRPNAEEYVGSSIQFQLELDTEQAQEFLLSCSKAGIELKWFGATTPHGFTSRYDSWQYFDNLPELPETQQILHRTFDMRIPLTFSVTDCTTIAESLCLIAVDF